MRFSEKELAEKAEEFEKSQVRVLHKLDSQLLLDEVTRRLSGTMTEEEITAAITPTGEDASVWRPGRITFKGLSKVLNVAGITYKELLEITNKNEDGSQAEIKWPKPSEERMCNLCDSVSDAARKCIYDMVMSMLPDAIKEYYTIKAVNSEKAIESAIYRAYDPSYVPSLFRKPFEMQDIYLNRTKALYRLQPHVMKFFADNLDVSYHWMLELDENTCVLAENGFTEVIMDAFCLLPDSWKDAVLAGVELYTKGV